MRKKNYFSIELRQGTKLYRPRGMQRPYNAFGPIKYKRYLVGKYFMSFDELLYNNISKRLN